MSHEGWKNYETWATALWIDNEEPKGAAIGEIDWYEIAEHVANE